jgi:hypothetical protein
VTEFFIVFVALFAAVSFGFGMWCGYGDGWSAGHSVGYRAGERTGHNHGVLSAREAVRAERERWLRAVESLAVLAWPNPCRRPAAIRY